MNVVADLFQPFKQLNNPLLRINNWIMFVYFPDFDCINQNENDV